MRPVTPYRHGVPPRILARLERILAHGVAKHGEPFFEPWEYALEVGALVHDHVAGALRHLGRAGDWGQVEDEETGERHLLHAAARLILLVSLLDHETLVPVKETK